MNHHFDFQVLVQSHGFLLRGLITTLEITIIAAVFGFLLGCGLAVLRLSKITSISWLSAAYVNLFRSVPLILVIFWFYMLVPKLIGQSTGAFRSVVIAFVLFEGAYYCEIIRAGVSGVRRRQADAGLALGFTSFQVMSFVILPQAIRAMVPVLLSQVITMFQDTSLVYVVGVRDFLTSANIVANTANRPFELYTIVAVVFLVICLSGSFWVSRLRVRSVR
jgi:glutamate/aspartate transport system permease protein